jgi:hypothetical protein
MSHAAMTHPSISSSGSLRAGDRLPEARHPLRPGFWVIGGGGVKERIVGYRMGLGRSSYIVGVIDRGGVGGGEEWEWEMEMECRVE